MILNNWIPFYERADQHSTTSSILFNTVDGSSYAEKHMHLSIKYGKFGGKTHVITRNVPGTTHGPAAYHGKFIFNLHFIHVQCIFPAVEKDMFLI